MRRTLFLMIVLAVLVLGANATAPVMAQDSHAQPNVDTNIRVQPNVRAPLITTLKKGTPVLIEARSEDSAWILLHTTDNAVRGWGYVRLFNFADGVLVRNFPVSAEALPEPTVVSPEISAPLPDGVSSLNAPYVPKITPGMRIAMRNLMEKGKALGNNYQVFSKVGDCQTDHHSFLKPFGWGQYDLRQYGYLQGVINYFMVQPRPDVGNSFDAQSIASHNGFNSSAVQQPEFAAPVCEPGEKPLICEYRLNKPGISIIMFGTADVLVMSPTQFRTFMTTIVKDTMSRGIIPILSTFPENPAVAEKSRQLNQIVVALARRYNVPLINLSDALKTIPNWGLDTDGIHLTNPPGDNAGVLSPENLQYGYSLRNLLVLQTLDAVWRGILN